jgi:hypothetical protein
MNSWDCFDTLLARSFNHPGTIFDIVAKKINDPTFPKKRIMAERISRYKTYEDIYSYLREYDPDVEFETEKEYTFPILENWNRVQDGDIIISDMYFSAEQIKSLLRHHGFNKDVKVLVTYGGKHSGRVWDWLRSSRININNHYGDNIYSDVKISRLYDINGVFFGGSLLTTDEQFLYKNNQPFLAALMRRSRLSNPYFRSRSFCIHNRGSFQNIAGHYWIEEIEGRLNYFIMHKNFDDYFLLKSIKYPDVLIRIYFNGEIYLEKENEELILLYKGNWLADPKNYTSESQRLIWIDQSQFNLPLLILISLVLPQDKNLVFSQRDCLFLNKIYNILLDKQAPMLEVSRRGYLNPFSMDYANYLISNTKDSIIIDSHGSGYSANRFFSGFGQPCHLYHIFKHYLNPRQKQLVHSHRDVPLDSRLECLSLGGRTWFCPGRSFEKYNIHSAGPLAGWDNGKAIRDECEHDPVICATIEQNIENVCSYLHLYKKYLYPTNDDILSQLANNLKNTFTDIVVTSIGQ